MNITFARSYINNIWAAVAGKSSPNMGYLLCTVMCTCMLKKSHFLWLAPKQFLEGSKAQEQKPASATLCGLPA